MLFLSHFLTGLCFYFVGDDSIYTLAVSKTQTFIQCQALPKGFKDSFNLFRHTFMDDGSQTADSRRATFLRLSPQFYNLLLRTPLSILAQKDTVNRLRIVPDGILGYLPFNLLMTQAHTTWKPDESYRQSPIPFLLNDYAVSYDYSRELMFDSTVQTFSSRKGTPKGYGGFGIQYDDLTIKLMRGIGKDLDKLDKSPLEVNAIKTQIGGSVFTDDANKPLTKDFFIKSKDRYSILHLSMHGAINDNDPLSSALIFSKPNAQHDNLLTAAEIYAYPFNNNDLTVLSACQTASGKLHRGEGIMSLARAFNVGGCKSVVATLWSVGNTQMYQLMPLFYKNLKNGMDKDLAMQAAQKTCLQDKTLQGSFLEPNKWAAPIVIGNLDKLQVESPNYWLWVVLCLSVLVGLWILYRRKKANV